MKRIGICLLAALLALLPAASLALRGGNGESQGTVVTASVPETHTLTVTCGEGGSVLVNGKRYTGTFTLDVRRLGTVTLTAVADEGWETEKLVVPSVEGVTLAGETITFSNVYENKTLSVVFAKLPEPEVTPKPEDTTKPEVTPKPEDTTKPENTAKPEVTPKPEDTAKPENTAKPEDTTKPSATATPTPKPTDKPASQPTEKPSSGQSGSGTTDANATSTPTPEPTLSPEEQLTVPVMPLGNLLYDGYLGTGEGTKQLSIVFDADYLPKDYELLPILEAGELLICAEPDEAGQTACRSLILSALQILRVEQDGEMGNLLFRNGDMTASMDMAQLYTGRVAKLIERGGSESLAAVDLSDPATLAELDAMPEPELTHAALAAARIEVRIEPAQTAAGREGYRVQVFLCMGEEKLDISALVDSLRVNLCVDGRLTEENRDGFTQDYGVAFTDETGERWLDSELCVLPEEMPEGEADETERFDVTILEPYPDVLHIPEAELAEWRVSVLSAPYAGDGVYGVGEK